MSNILLVPVHLDALVLDRDQMVVETTADFSRLPFSTGSHDINPDIANISEELVSTPFQNENLLLRKGIHLHWSLPDALTRARPDPKNLEEQVFPLVPNRWLVTRCNQTGVVEKEWIVESDYLHPVSSAKVGDGVAIPYYKAAKGQPFRFMGRTIILTHQDTGEREYYPQLTAVGYGEPAFAAYYPNCHSVFGFFDEEYSGKKDGRQYYLAGWYSNAANDVLQAHARDAKTLKDSFKWDITPAGQEFPTRMVCYARLVVGELIPKTISQRLSVAIGNTGTEALSACLAPKVHGNAAKRIVEDHLEAIDLADALEYRQLDIAPKFDEARHEKGFTAVAGGTIWTVRAESTPDRPADATHVSTGITLPREIGRLLNVVNQWQAKYDRAWQEIESLRIQLFSDWYKYMLCAYPPADTRDAYPNIDKVAWYIDKHVDSLKKRINEIGQLAVDDKTGRVVATTPSAGDLAVALANAINEVQALLDARKHPPRYQLKQTSGPRYWRPTEPSVLLEGPLAKPSRRHGQDGRPKDGLLETQLLTGADTTMDPSAKTWRDRIRERIAELSSNRDNFACTTWHGQPWNPFMLEWEVEVFPIAHNSNINPSTGCFAEDFITTNYQLVENDVDLSLKQGKGATTSAANIYRGRCILTPHASKQAAEQTEDYLEKEVLPQFFTQKNTPASEQVDGYLKHNLSEVRAWYERSNKSLLRGRNAKLDPNLTALHALGELNKAESLSQALSGFNEALLMHKQTLQLDIADPLGFADYQRFAQDVGNTVNDSIYSAPAPLNDFNPIRSGMMQIHKLRLIDTFGQIKDLDVSKILCSESLDNNSEDPFIALPPRLMQPARINFRWLSADADQEEMNDHPATTPICGWVLANNLDNSLMIYDNDGKALGSLVRRDARVEWVRAPGGLGVRYVGDIPNSHLQKMVTKIKSWGGVFLHDFISVIDSAVENIEPENFAQHQDLALLMGRPLALVRASLNLELKGLPATHQGWNEFRQAMQKGTRNDNGFTEVRFPIRISEYRQFNDGTVGYWKEKDDTYEDETFFAPQSDTDVELTGGHLKTRNTVFFQRLKSEPQILSLLIDPRGVVHATTGILPCKAISIPPDQYAAALQAIEITFLSTPVLTDAGKIRLPLPEEAGYKWSWLHQNLDHEWTEISERGVVKRDSFAALAVDVEVLWEELKGRGWIKLLNPPDDARASVVAKDDRDEPTLDKFEEQTDKIEDILDRVHIGPVDPAAKFSGPQEIREGWLKLSSADAA